MSDKITVWPMAIWTGSQWIEGDRKKWPPGFPEHVIVECEPALGVLNVGRVVLAAHAMQELEAALEPDFGDDPGRPTSWLVIGIRADLSRATQKRKRAQGQ